MEVLVTPRLTLEPISLELVEAVFRGDRPELERLARARASANWPGKALVERAFSASLERIREDPDTRLWGDRLMITREGERRIVGSVIFHGKPNENGLVEVGYGVEESWQNQGLATEATRTQVEWALGAPGVRLVMATTPPWHTASIRVLEKSGLARVRTEEHEILGEVLVFARER